MQMLIRGTICFLNSKKAYSVKMSAVYVCASVRTPGRCSFLSHANKRLPLEALPAGRKLIVLLITESVWCMLALVSHCFFPQRMPRGTRPVMARCGWWPLRRQCVSWCSSSPWAYLCAAGWRKPGPTRDPCKERWDVWLPLSWRAITLHFPSCSWSAVWLLDFLMPLHSLLHLTVPFAQSLPVQLRFILPYSYYRIHSSVTFHMCWIVR